MVRIMELYHKWYPLVFLLYNFGFVPAQHLLRRQTSSTVQFLWVVFLVRATRRFPGVVRPAEYTQTVALLTICGINSLYRNLSL